MRNFIYKNIKAISMVFTTICFVIGLIAGDRARTLYTSRNK